MIWKLLRKNISVSQILGYAIANFIGLSIVLSAVRFYCDVRSIFNDEDGNNGLISADYLVISKPVSTLNFLGGSSDFSKSEINDIQSQSWTSKVGQFSSADFNVSASINLGSQGLQSFMFMESIPNDFIDICPDEWAFDETEGAAATIPIIISKDYLALYNFGLAPSRGLPQLSESLISKVPLMLHVSGNGHYDTLRAKIVGFSSRLNTIAVPQHFMEWANRRYGNNIDLKPSRLIVKVNNPGDPHIDSYMKSRGYEVAGDKLNSGKASFFFTLLTSIIIAVGIVISALALFILLLSLHLLMQKNRKKICDLMLLGYSTRQVSIGYYRLIGAVNSLVLILSITAMFVASSLWEKQLSQLHLSPSSPWYAIIAAIAIMGIITAINFLAVSRSVLKAWK